jgi:hypothetical protein
MKKLNILVALPPGNPTIESIHRLLIGEESCSGTIGSFVRGAQLLSLQGHAVTLSGSILSGAEGISFAEHSDVDPAAFDLIVAHQSHWKEDVEVFTFGNAMLPKTILWLQNQGKWQSVSSFWKHGGISIVCPTLFHANLYRALPGFHKRANAVYNSFCPVFTSDESVTPQPGRILFVGAITPSKGFLEVMSTWKELATRGVDIELVIAGSIGLHTGAGGGEARPIGVADPKFEIEAIAPWLASLPERYQPRFLGALAPVQLREEMLKSEAILVNPSWHSYETFCVAAVEAQVCGRPVFSVARGGLNETVYPSRLQTLATAPGSSTMADVIQRGFSDKAALRETGQAATAWALRAFDPAVISSQWAKVIAGERNELSFPWLGSSRRDLVCDGLRMTGAALLFEKLVLKR